MFNFGDNVDRDIRSTKSNEPATVDFRQTGDKSATKLVDSRLCRQCVPGFATVDNTGRKTTVSSVEHGSALTVVRV